MGDGTPTSNEPLGPAEDAEIISEGPRPPAPPPRTAELKPAGENFTVFDGPVDEAKNAKRRPDVDARPKAKVKAKRGAKAEPAAASEPAAPAMTPEQLHQAKLNEAKGLIRMWEMGQVNKVRARYKKISTSESLEALCRQVRLSPAELEELAEPIAEGMVELGVSLPWWGRALLIAYTITSARNGLLEEYEAKFQEWKQSQDAEAEAGKPKEKQAA